MDLYCAAQNSCRESLQVVAGPGQPFDSTGEIQTHSVVISVASKLFLKYNGLI